ncbi:MAG: hypothetical protein AB7N65_15540, partial [Vicinamibacterales bacterium]
MTRTSRILRDYSDAGSVSELIALWGFVDESTFLTKAGHVGLVYRVRGVEFEGLPHEQRKAVAHQMEAGVRLLDERCRVYQYLVKRNIDSLVAPRSARRVAAEAMARRTAYLNDRRSELYEIGQYLVLLYEAPHVVRKSTSLGSLFSAPGRAIRDWLSPDATISMLESDLDRAVSLLHHKAGAFEVQVQEIGLERLGKADTYLFLRELVNHDRHVATAAR